MNLEQKISRLKTVADQDPAMPAEKSVDVHANIEIWDWVRKYVSEHPDRPSGLDGPDWKPRDPVEWANEMYAARAIQPAPRLTDSMGGPYSWDDFKIGRVVNRDRRPSKSGQYCDREAIPLPRFPNPGQPATPEMWDEFQRETNLWYSASLKLVHLIHLLRTRETDPEFFNRPSMFLSEELAKYKEFLTGVWAGKGLHAPSDEEINHWALPEKHKPAPGPGQKLVEYRDHGGNRIYEVEDDDARL